MDYLLEQSKIQRLYTTYTFSFLEIYNENVRDLLKENKNLTIIEDQIKGVIVQELTELKI